MLDVRLELLIMSKLLFLGMWMLLFFAVVCSLTCYKCFRELNNGKCRTGKESCVAKHGESCFRQKIIAESVTLYISAGCGLNCKEVNAGLQIHHFNKCCSRDMCNRP